MNKMWASKLCFCSNAARSSFFQRPQTLSRTFSSLNCLSQHFKKACKPIQSFQLFCKSQIKCSPIRIKSTVALDQNTLQLQRTNARRRQISFWLLTCCGMTYILISLGGYTRLTESGLSMVTWRLTFEDMPHSEEEWAAEFAKYQQYPEFKLLKKDLTLEQFKQIFMVEYFHRLWGRIVGMMFFFPATSFWLRGYFSSSMKKRVVIYGSLIIAQGLLGWYMVKSGLEDRFEGQSDVPRVSQYRLAAHLTMALTLYVGLLWSALDHLLKPEVMPALTKGIRKLKMMAGSTKGLVFLTAISGAFVAGLDAGLIYNSFPKMGNNWIPSEILEMSPVMKNFTENPTTVQFDHRILGITTFSVAIATWILARREKLPPRVKLAAQSVAIMACCQVALGITTLVHNVQTHLALTHQSGSVVFLTTATWLLHELSKMKFIPK